MTIFSCTAAPHLDAHRTLALPFNALRNGREVEEVRDYRNVSDFEREYRHQR